MATIDWEQFNENFQYYDKETIQEVIKDFFEESEQRMANLEQNIANCDFEKLAFNAHSLKSVVGNFMAPKPYELTRKLEEMAKQKSSDDIHVVFVDLKQQIFELMAELREYLSTN